MSRKRTRRERKQRRRSLAAGPGARPPKPTPPHKLLEDAGGQAQRIASSYLRRDDLPVTVIELADQTRTLALHVIQKSALSGKHECKTGCAFCCHTAVNVAAPEAFSIARYLVDHGSADDLQEVQRRMERNAKLALCMTRDEYVAASIPCALLTDDGNCLAHPVRPLACVGFLSTSRAKCEAEFKREPGRDPVPTDKFAAAAGMCVSIGLRDACSKADLDGTFYEIHHALRRVMDTPDAVERWARGEAVFAGCLHQ